MHAAAEEAKKAYGRRTYMSAEGDQEELGPTFTNDNGKLINHYTNKVSLQKKYQTGDANAGATGINDSANDDLSDLDRDEMNGIYGGRQQYYSEYDHLQKSVKSKNLIEIFYE